jgi:hypothetical protein
MNDVLYKDLIEPWIAIHERNVLRKIDMWFIGIKKIHLMPSFHNLLSDIGVHTGCPCYRYCTCIYISLEDRRDAYERNVKCSPSIF